MIVRALSRVSVIRPDEIKAQLSIAERSITAWSRFKHPDAEIVWYVDKGVSGRKALADRPEGGRLWREIQDGDVLAVTKFDRLARSTRNLLDIASECDERNITIVATEQDIDTSGAMGQFLLTILGAVAQLEAEIDSERILASYEQYRIEGRHGMGRLSYGWHSVKHPDKGFLVARPEPTEAPKLREAILALISGESQLSQAEALGLPEPTFRKILDNTRLYGQIPKGKFDQEQAIISRAEWTALQATRNGNRNYTRADGYGAVLRCCVCKTRLYWNRARRPLPGGAYACRGEHAGQVSIGRDIADAFIESYYREHYGQHPVLRKVESDDTERAERLAELQMEVDETSAAMADRSNVSQIPELAQRLTELHHEREAVELEPSETDTRYEATDMRAGHYFDGLDSAGRADLVGQVIEVTVHPRGHKDGRLEATELEPSAVGVVVIT